MKISLWLKIVFFVVVFFSTFAFYSRAVFGASVALDVSSARNVLSGVNSFSSGSFNFSSMNPAMLPATYDSINQYLFSNFGYDVSDAIDYGVDNLTGWATGQISNPLNGADVLSSASANFVADALGAGMTAQMVIENGFKYFAQSVPQWGENAKQFFLGKIDDVTGKITDVGSSVLTKVTAQGLSAYNQVYNNLVQNGQIINGSIPGVYLVRDFDDTYRTSTSSSGIKPLNIIFSEPVFIYTERTTVSPSRHYTHIVCPLDSLFTFDDRLYLPCSGSMLSGSISYLRVYWSSTFIINDIEYINFTFVCCDSDYEPLDVFVVGSQKVISSLDNIRSFLSLDSDVSDSSLSYDYYDSDFSIALKGQLDRLIDNYIDSLTLQRINDIISTIPIDVVNNETVVSVPTQDIIDELTAIIDDAIEDSLIYDDVFDAYYEDAVDIPITPDPPSDDTDIYVPIDVPTTPINAIGSALTVPYMFSSIFEPIFIAFGGGLFSLWLFVPTLIIFVAILWAIK